MGSGMIQQKSFDFSDWDWCNKVKVRIVGYHNPNRKELPTDELPWAQVMMPCTSSQRSGVGSNHQLQVNAWVIGFFMDGASSQIPIVMGTIGDENPRKTYGTRKGKKRGFEQLCAPDYDFNKFSESGSCPPNTGNTVEKNERLV